MKRNRLEIIISAPVEKVFEFTTNPSNTPKWIKNIVREETNEFPIKIGTKYKNLDDKGVWTEYKVVLLEQNKLFQLKQINSFYSVRYNYESISADATKLTYTEWVEKGNLDNPLAQSVLEKLKLVIK
jgi:hypothetical protein